VLKYITQTGELLAGKILLFDAQTMQSRAVKIGAVTKTNITALPQTTTAETMSAAEVKAGLEAGTVQLIDIRSSDEHDDFNIGGMHIPTYKLESVLTGLDSSKTIILYCTIGKRSADAVKKLKNTYPQLRICSLEGGVKAWLQAVSL
jgi:adenylyltransferase/sulfurtransferase